MSNFVSYWQNCKEIHRHKGFVVLYGEYNHKNENPVGELCVGMYWDNGDDPSFPNSRGKISPLVLEQSLVSGVLKTITQERRNVNLSTYDVEVAAIQFNVDLK